MWTAAEGNVQSAVAVEKIQLWYSYVALKNSNNVVGLSLLLADSSFTNERCSETMSSIKVRFGVLHFNILSIKYLTMGWLFWFGIDWY